MKTNMLIIAMLDLEMEETNARNLYRPANTGLLSWK